MALLLETARRAFSVDVVELAKGILLIVESLVMEANESDIGITDSALTSMMLKIECSHASSRHLSNMRLCIMSIREWLLTSSLTDLRL